MNTFGIIQKTIALHFELQNLAQYTSHYFYMTSATILGDAVKGVHNFKVFRLFTNYKIYLYNTYLFIQGLGNLYINT